MLRSGELLQGRYMIDQPLGRGGFGAVYLAHDQRLGKRKVAIKHFYTAHLSADEREEIARMFKVEAHTLARLNHPNLAKVFDYFSDANDWFLVMEFIPGETLSALMKREQSGLDQQQVIQWGIELCRVLEYLHSQSPPLIFRDLKPANIMLTPDEHVVLIDFGIVRSFKEGQQRDTVQIGTPGYAPPEQYGGQTEPRSDLYSLGVTMYALLTGERPTGTTFMFPHLRERAPHVNPALADLLANATSYQIDVRPPSATVMRQALETIQSGSSAAYVGTTHSIHDAQTSVINRPQRQQSAGTGSQPAQGGPVRRQIQPLPSRLPDAPRSSRSWVPLLALLLVLAIGGGVYVIYTQLRDSASAIDGDPEPGAGQRYELLISGGSGTDRDITLRDLESREQSTLISGTTYDALASAAPDGRIAFTRSGDIYEHILVAAADGSDTRELTSGKSINRAPVWSPDGRQIAYESNRHTGIDAERDIFVMLPDGTRTRQLTAEEGWQGGPAWSPDGRQIAYHSRLPVAGSRYTIRVFDFSNGETRELAAIAGEDLFWPSWSPDGETIAFMATRGDLPDVIYLIPAEGGEPELLELGPASNRWPRWSPDGQLLAFETTRHFESGEFPWQVYVYDVQSGAATRISDGSRDERWPAWRER